MAHVHRIKEKDPETRRGVCAACGPVRLMPKRNSAGTVSWRCAVAIKEQRGDHWIAVLRANYVSKGKKGNTHGLTRDQATALREGRTCALDGCQSPAEHVDHCHATGKIREPLCGPHNVGLGWFNDDPAMLRAAADYIERHRAAAPSAGPSAGATSRDRRTAV